ncbi:MAG: (4Fe-4S)-binding protein [Cytophagaceae bacterium]|jgi:uncharacterized Fe-S cluster protein YjdI|nr:(4Fe-4S)-binding protein [Cytophagaceae bacterium]
MDKEHVTKKYRNADIEVVWQPHLCTHSKKCWRNLPEVFDPMARPWITLDGAETEKIKDQVDQCPSGALKWNKLKNSGS